MNKIESFNIDHERLSCGLYISRKDRYNGVTVTTFDLRMAKPNRDVPLDSAGMHTIEHIGATFLRNSDHKERVVYFGPMGCRTGFYLVMFDELAVTDIDYLIKSMLEYIINFEGEIYGASAKECGNYKLQSLQLAKAYATHYLNELCKHKRYVYPK